MGRAWPPLEERGGAWKNLEAATLQLAACTTFDTIIRHAHAAATHVEGLDSIPQQLQGLYLSGAAAGPC